MKSNIKLVSTNDMSREAWLAYRFCGLGASEVGTVMGLDPYKSSIQLFYEKIGEYHASNVENISMFLGKNQEEFISDMWEYWGGTQESMIENFNSGNKVRRCRRVNAYAHNDKYPWLFVSLDFEINKHNGKGNGTLETKTIGGYNADKWEAGIPVGYVTQVQDQMLVCEYEYGEIAILKDNRDFNVIEFEYNASICEGIIERTKIFWDTVEAGRVAITKRLNAKMEFNYSQVEELNAEIASLEPSPDGTDAYNNFLKEKYQIALPGERIGTVIELQTAIAHKEVDTRLKSLEEEKQLYSNTLKNYIKDGCDKLDFGVNGFVSWKANKNGVRTLQNKVK